MRWGVAYSGSPPSILFVEPPKMAILSTFSGRNPVTLALGAAFGVTSCEELLLPQGSTMLVKGAGVHRTGETWIRRSSSEKKWDWEYLVVPSRPVP